MNTNVCGLGVRLSDTRRTHNCDQEDTYPGPQPPLSANWFVVLPQHPLYGRLVTVLARRSSATSIRCVVEDPSHPGFHYLVPERWLAPTAPHTPVGDSSSHHGLRLALAALDKMVQLVLAIQPPRRETPNAPALTRDDPPDRDPASSHRSNPTADPALPPGAQSRRRSAS